MSTRGIAQVFDDLGNPLVITGDSRFLADGHGCLSRYLLVPNCLLF